ncbi:MAG: GGDEF domain-containing protein, partial [Terracidiphilus sp.]
RRCAEQLLQVTARLERVANLEDLSEIRASIEGSAREMKSSIDRMAAEGSAAIAELRAKLASYQTRLEEAELLASRDPLTGVRNRLWLESRIEQALQAGTRFTVAVVDIDRFKQVNDTLGHVAGDELLRQFASELRSACRSSDFVGRWGGDEFLVLLECGLEQARVQVDRARQWVCGDYEISGLAGKRKLGVEASFGLAERRPGESMKQLLARADAEMYADKAQRRSSERACSPARRAATS